MQRDFCSHEEMRARVWNEHAIAEPRIGIVGLCCTRIVKDDLNCCILLFEFFSSMRLTIHVCIKIVAATPLVFEQLVTTCLIGGQGELTEKSTFCYPSSRKTIITAVYMPATLLLNKYRQGKKKRNSVPSRGRYF